MRKNVAAQICGAQINSKTDGTPVTSGTTTVYVTGDGGTQATGSVGSGVCTHEGHGFWTYAPAQAETNYDHVAFTFENSSGVNATVQIYPSFPQTGDNYARLGAPAGASVSADVAAVKVDTAAVKVKTDFLPSATAGAAGGVFIAGSNAATSITTALTANVIGNVTGNLSGSVGSVTGAVGSVTAAVTVGTINANVITATAINADAITAAKIADGAIDAATFAAGAINAAAIAADAITAAKVADGTIDAATFAAGAINAAAIAADAITDAKVASDVTIASVTGAVGSVTGNVGGNVVGSVASVTAAVTVGTINSGVINAAAIADAAIDRATFAADTGLLSARSGTAQAGAAASITLDASASAVTDFYVGLWIGLTGGTGVGQVRLCTAYNGSTKVATVAPNWATNPDATSTFAAMPAADVRGVQGNVTGSVGSVTGAVGSVTGAVGSVTGNVGGNVVGSVASVTARVSANTDQLAGQTVTAAAGVTFPASVASPTNITAGTITTTTNVTNDVGITQAGADKAWSTTTRALTDKVGFALSAAGVQAIWDALTSALTTVGSIGKRIVDNLDAAITSRMATFTYTAPLDAAGTRSAVGLASANLDTQLSALQSDTDNIQTRLPAALVSGRMDSSVGAMAADVVTASAIATDAIGALELAAGAASEIATAVRTELATELARVDVAVSSRMATFTYTAPDNAGIAAIMGVTTKLNYTLELGVGSPSYYRFTAGALELAPTGGSAPSAATIADAVWDELLSGHVISGSAGAGLAAASSAGDPWSTALPGAYGVGTAGKIIGTNIDALISSRTKPADTQAAVTTVTNLTNAPTSGDLTATMKASVTTAASAATPTVTAGTVSDKTGYRLSATGVDDVWDEAIAGHLGAGSTGLALNDATAAGNPWNATLEGALTASDLLRIVAGVAVGKTVIVAPGNGTAHVEFRDASDLSLIVAADLTGSERTAVALTP